MTGTDDVRAQKLAEQCAEIMLHEDHCSVQHGMVLVDVSPGYAKVRMPVRDDMLNGHGSCHGGMMFMLADTAFAVACNSRNQKCVAQHCDVSFVMPVAEGDVLEAVSTERWREGRSGIYDVTVVNKAGDTVAEFRGRSRTVKGLHVEP